MIDTAAHTGIGSFIRKKLSEAEWKASARRHRDRISELIDDYLDKRQRQQKDPVLDFLFEYYAFRPSHLKRWSPGFGVLLKGSDFSDPESEIEELAVAGDGAYIDPERFPGHRRSSLRWILQVLKQSSKKEPSFGCFGMHEWAMVYRADTVRHSQYPLRMDEEELAEFVESRPLVCTHFDAFRFFTEKARPRNKHRLSRDTFREMEQPGCIHTNMDLYKWAFKMYPWISSDTIRRAFELAVKARFIDMQASPYDLRERGLQPIKIETEAGRLEYVEQQREIYEKSRPVRSQLIGEYRRLADALDININV